MTQSSAVANLKEQIKVRGLSLGGFKNTPLTRFRATLTSWDAYIQLATQAGWADRTMVRLEFNKGDLVVIKSDIPYSHPNAVVEIGYSDNGIRADGQGNAWAFFVESCLRVIPEGQGVDALMNHVLEIEWRSSFLKEDGTLQPCMIWGGAQNPKAVLREVFTLIGYDGVLFKGASEPGTGVPTAVGAPSSEALPDLDTQILNAIDGKNKTDANASLMSMEAVRSSRMSDVLSGKIYDDLVEAGKITVDEEGVYHKV